MPFEYAGFEMAYDLMRIWSDAFPQDNADDIRKFITLALKTYNCAVWKEDGHPVSMAFTLPAVLELKSGSLNLCYIYAAATLTEYRGQGLFARLLGNVQEQLANNGVDACFLRPASPRLFDYYGRLGYKPFFYFISENLSSDDFQVNTDRSLNDFTEIQETAFRNKLLENHSAWVRWPDVLLSFAMQNAVQTGGAVIGGDRGWAICERYGDKLFIREWLCGPEMEEALRRKVAVRFPGLDIIRRRPVNQTEILQSEPFGMLYPLTNAAAEKIKTVESAIPYMGLAFD
ncbi:MAG TPA: hypothetical protein DEP23_15860 [Ruminococcaceae bacterium]|jgi:hypothetical protein|nr:hypothetical protein [Oscillospiraceae bacterium]